MAANEDDLKLKVSSTGVDESTSAFAKLNEQLKQSVAFVQQQARETKAATTVATEHSKGIGGLVSSLQNLRSAYQSGTATGGEFTNVLGLMGKGIGALMSPIGIAVIGLGALVAIIHKSAQQAIALKEEIEHLKAATGLSAREADVFMESWKLAGASTETVRAAMYRLSYTIENGGEGLERYGVSAKTATGELKKASDAFGELHKKLEGFSDEARLGILTRMFGRGLGGQLAASFSTTSEEMNRFKNIAAETSSVNDEFINKAKKLQEVQEELSRRTLQARLEFAELIALPVATFFADTTNAILKMTKYGITGIKELANSMLTVLDPFGTMGLKKKFGFEIGVKSEAVEPKASTGKTKLPTSDDEAQVADRKVQIELDMRRRQLTADESYFIQLNQLETDSASGSIAIKKQTLEATIAMANEEFDRRIAIEKSRSLSGEYISPEKQLQFEAARDTQVADAKNKLRDLELEKERAHADDIIKVRDDLTGRMKAILDVQARMIDENKNRELMMNELSFQSSERQMLTRYETEQRFITQSSALKINAIDAEMDMLRKQAGMFQGNAAMQREINNKLIGLQRDRAMAELDTNRQILDSRKALVDKLIAESQREAGAGGNLTSKAISNLRAKGKTSFSQSDVVREIGDIQSKGVRTAGAFASGGTVKAEDYEEAQQTQGGFRDLASLGATITGAVNTMSQMMLKAFRGDLTPTLPSTVKPTSTGFEPSRDSLTDEGGRAREAPINLELETARNELQRARNAQAAANAPSTAGGLSAASASAVEGTTGLLQTKITEAASKAVTAIDFSKVFDTFADALVRKLQFEAQRA